VLGVLVALVSVLTFAAAVWKSKFYRPAPQPLFALAQITSSRAAYFTISNGGDAPMSLESATLAVGSGKSGLTLPLTMSLGNEITIVKPNSIIAAKAIIASVPRMKLDRMFDLLNSSETLPCQFWISVFDASGRRSVSSAHASINSCHLTAFLLTREAIFNSNALVDDGSAAKSAQSK
jgi:hypothetical protein